MSHTGTSKNRHINKCYICIYIYIYIYIIFIYYKYCYIYTLYIIKIIYCHILILGHRKTGIYIKILYIYHIYYYIHIYIYIYIYIYIINEGTIQCGIWIQIICPYTCCCRSNWTSYSRLLFSSVFIFSIITVIVIWQTGICRKGILVMHDMFSHFQKPRLHQTMYSHSFLNFSSY